MSSPTQRTLAELKKRGYPLVQVVERWNSFARVRQDLFGIIDVVAVTNEGDTIGIQATSRSNMSARIKKIAEHESTPKLRQAGWWLWVWGWDKGPDGRWRLKEEDVS